jgi:alkylhydroperoxidase family enzyme
MANLAHIYQASADKIAAVWEYQTSPLFSEAERAALGLAFRASIVPNEVGDDDFAGLKKYFDDEQIVEIVASVALFGYLNRWNDTMSTDLEEYPGGVAAELIGAVGWSAGKHAAETG